MVVPSSSLPLFIHFTHVLVSCELAASNRSDKRERMFEATKKLFNQVRKKRWWYSVYQYLVASRAVCGPCVLCIGVK